jgi:hypothetical protein
MTGTRTVLTGLYRKPVETTNSGDLGVMLSTNSSTLSRWEKLDGNSELFVSSASSYRHSHLAVPISLPCSYAVYLGILSFYFVIIFLFFPETKRMSAEDASVGK